MSFEHIEEFLRPFTEGLTGYLAFTKATRSDDPEINNRWESHTLSNYFAQVTSGDFSLPDEIFEDENIEAYFAPAVFDENYRREAHFAGSNALWVDFDGPVNWQALDPAPSIVVQTSDSGKVHCYWLLQQPITNVADIRYMNKRLQEGYEEGADPSGFDAGQLLKLPFGRNLKLANRRADGTYFAPEILKFDAQLRYREASFSHLPEPTAPSMVVDLSDIGDVPELTMRWDQYMETLNVPGEIQLKLFKLQDGGEEKRSGGLFSLECALMDLYPNEDVFRVLYSSPNDKFSSDFGAAIGAKRLWQDINRVRVKQERKNAAQGASDEIGAILSAKGVVARDKSKDVNDIIQRKLAEDGKYIQSEDGDFFYVDERTEYPKLWRVETQPSGTFAGMIFNRFGVSPGTDQAIMKDILHASFYECQGRPKLPFHHFSYYDEMDNIVYVNRNDGTLYQLDGETVTVVPQGYKGIYFYNSDDAYPKPFEYNPQYRPGGLDALILTGPNYTINTKNITKKHVKHILLTWISTFFFLTKMNTRPIVLFFGEADSGKSSFFQNISLLFTGNALHSVVGMPKDVRDFNVQVCKNSFIFYDNVEVNKTEMQEQLAKAATGFSVKDRKLHTNSETSYMTARAFIGLTSRTVDRIQKDVAQRHIVIPVHPYDGNNRKTSSEIQGDVLRARNDLFSELMDFVNRIVKEIGRNGLQSATSDKIKMRMADYAQFLHLTAGLVGLSGPEMESFILQQQSNTVGENDTLYPALRKFAKTQRDSSTRWTVGDLYQNLTRVDRKLSRQYTTVKKFGDGLKAAAQGETFKYHGLKVVATKYGNSFRYTVELMFDPDTLVE